MQRYRLLTWFYLAFWSIVIGITTGVYLNTINVVIDLLWRDLTNLLNIPTQWKAVAVCLPLSLVIGLTQKYIGAYPLTIAEILSETKIKGHFDYHRWWKILFAGLLILGSGASVGPEASASGLVAGMIYWLGCRYKLIRDHADVGSHKSFFDQIHLIWLTRLEHTDHQKPLTEYFRSDRQRKIFYLFWTLVATVGFFGYFHFFPQEGVIGFHHPQVAWQWQGILVVIPAMVIGWLFGFLFVKISELSVKWVGRWNAPIIKAILCGMLLVCAAMFSKDILFSGEFSIVPFAHSSLQLAPGFLIALAFIKALVTNLGFALGWRGGTIFPAIFSSVAIGATLAQFLQWMPKLTASLVVATAITVILEKSLISAIVLMLLLPIQFSIFILLICVLTNWILKKIPILKP